MTRGTCSSIPFHDPATDPVLVLHVQLDIDPSGSPQVQKKFRSYFSYRPSRFSRDLRIAFYSGRVSDFQSLVTRSKYQDPVRLLDPFSRDIYDRLDPVLQEMYLLDTVPQVIFNPEGGGDLLDAFDELVAAQSAPGDELAGCKSKGQTEEPHRRGPSADPAVSAAVVQAGIH